jgi:pyruvate/2-oxoglutarate dehydrogenase complex dihydrolipoamide dehydrogenase (E3) component
MERVRKIRAEISENDSVERFHKFLGVDTYLGEAKFIGKNQVQVNGQTLTFLKCTIASGGRPYLPSIPGLESIPYHTTESIFNLTKQPKSLLILGSGPIGCELGQGFQRLGTQVHMIERSGKFLPREDTDAAHILQEQLKKDGINVHLNSSIASFELVS